MSNVEVADPSLPEVSSWDAKERQLIWVSLWISFANVLLYWGHRLPGLRYLADLLSQAQLFWRHSFGSDVWLIRAWFLFPCALFALLLLRQLVPLRRIAPKNALLLLGNALLALHAWSCVDILTR